MLQVLRQRPRGWLALAPEIARTRTMSTTFQLDTATSRATPTPQPMRRLTVPKIRQRKKDGVTEQPLVMLTAYTDRKSVV